MPRRTWLDSKIDVFLEELAASGMHLDRHRAGELITGQVRAVATLMRVTEATARTYLGDEIIKDMARRMLFEVAGERPGADLMEAPRTVPLSLALVGITVAALAEAMQVRAANEPSDHLGDIITTCAQTLSGLGQITADAAPEQAGASEIVFALAWAPGYRWARRLADLPDQRLWRIDREAHYGPLNGLARNRINTRLITDNWDETCRPARDVRS